MWGVLATAVLARPEDKNEDLPEIQPGVLAGVEISDAQELDLQEVHKNAIKELVTKASKRDYPARLIEVVQAWEAALFYRGFQFLFPRYGGGWIIPGESSGYGATMQVDLSLLPTNIYSSYAQIIISSLTRAVPNVRWEPQDADNDVQITATEAADKFVKVVARNNDLTMIQTDAARYLWCDGRMLYYTRFVKDGQRFGWENQDEPESIVPETEPSSEQVDEVMAGLEEQGESEQPAAERIPRGQEVRTAHGKLEVKLTPMMANSLAEVDVLQYETEVSISRAKAMFPHVADEIKSGSNGITEGEIAKLARLNVKLGMQSTYITSDSIADDCTIQRNWLRPSEFMEIKNKEIRDFFISKCPDGIAVAYAGETLCYARNESMDDCWALAQAYSGDGQNRNALGTSLMPLQKRLNNWLDLMNDLFIRCIPKKWMHNKAFDVEAIRAQTNIPGDVGSYRPQAGMTADQLVFVEPVITVPASLPDFIKAYSGELAELVSAGYPALAGGDTGQNDLMDVDEFIPTPEGFVRNGDLLDGDLIFGQDGKQYAITKAHPHKIKQSFKVTFDDGTFTHVHDGHLWTTFTHDERVSLKRRTSEWRAERRAARNSRATFSRGATYSQSLAQRNSAMIWPTLPSPQGTVRRTDEILATLKGANGRSNHSVRIAEAIDLPEKILSLDPYCLGAWLGDGSSASGGFTGAEDDALEILFHFQEAGFSFRKRNDKTDKHAWYITGIIGKLRTLGVLKNKHIPHDYLWSSASQRLALLQGLMDTDGCATTIGTAVFVNTNKLLADGVYHLAASLGLKPMRGEQRSIPIYNKKYRRWYGGDVPTYRVSWTSSAPVFRMHRKLARLKEKNRKTQGWRYITNIELAGERTMRCLTTANPTGLYLFGNNFNVTHNTARGIAIQRDQALGRIGPTWHAIQNAEATAMGQAVRWAARCRDKSINERVPGGDAVRLEVNDLKAHILCFPQADENFPETYTQKQQRLMGLLDGSAKNPMLQEVFFNAANLMFLKRMVALDELYIPQVASFEKQLGEIEVMLKTTPAPNPAVAAAEQKIAAVKAIPGIDPAMLMQAEQQLAQMPQQQVSSIQVDADTEDCDTEAMCCWQYLNSPEGRKAKQTNPQGYQNVRLHFLETVQAAEDKKAKGAPKPPQKPVSVSLSYKDIPDQAEADQVLMNAGIQPSPKPPNAMTPGANAMLPPPPPEQTAAAR